MDQVFLITSDDEIFLGTVEEIIYGAKGSIACQGISFNAAILDIVAGILGDPDSNRRVFAIELRPE